VHSRTLPPTQESGCFLKNKVRPLTLEHIHERVIQYLLQIVRTVNPRKLLFLAFDGVAPRAKINQSRDRRFRSGVEDIDFFEQLVRAVGISTEENFEANSISPGTQFLFGLCRFLKERVMELLGSEWRGLHVLYSDCCVPGEGEHKIMDFLRFSKGAQLFPPSTTHCVYSPDADVILLTLALDLPYVAIVKEDTSQLPSFSWTASSTFRKAGGPQFELVLISILREYLEAEFAEELREVAGSKVQDVIDDFVLLMAFIGNDFLPVEFCFKLSEVHMDALLAHYRHHLRQH
jgi:5'-3' exoribonuclease 1